MTAILKNGAVFLHIPKTGGNWVTKILEELNLIERHIAHKHADIDHLFYALYEIPVGRKAIARQALRELISPSRECTSRPFMFCFTRNPLTWYESWFKYMAQPRRNWRSWGREGGAAKWHPNMMLNGLGSDDFNQFIRNVVAKRPGYVTEMYGWYAKPEVDFIGKQESLVEDLIRVLKIMEFEFDADFVRNQEPVGVSPEPKQSIEWDYELKREVALYEYAGMIRHGYRDTLAELGLAPGQLGVGTEP
ncbi:hypothetical protein [uncultured Thiohalocapsa sp.]|uniref:hypothetical protein n=1 Tax=uncultured Thiohalocapsa sp. TaxID=768990 RepID=UPI0025F75128|nr:hypothetical protein [uncultured Thiohalocapsa sp.]